jgi:hypothetical protein
MKSFESRLFCVNARLEAVREMIRRERGRLACLYIRYALSPWEK